MPQLVADALLAVPAAAALSFSAFWRRSPRLPEPQLPAGLTLADYDTLATILGLYCGVRKLHATIEGGDVTMGRQGRFQRFPLHELAAVCRSRRHSEWPDIVAAYCNARLATAEAPAARTRPAAAVRAAAPAGQGDQAAEHAAWRTFGALVRECFRRHGYQATVEGDGVLARDADGSELHVAAPGLERAVHAQPRERWAAVIDAIFGEQLRTLRGRQALAGRLYAPMRELLAVQLYDEAWLTEEARRDGLCMRELPGLVSAVVCRLPQATFRLSLQTVAEWGQHVDEVRAAALANLRLMRPRVERKLLAPCVEGMRFQADDAFVAAQALTLGEEPDCAHAYGALVALPRRERLLVCPLRPVRGAAALYTEAAQALIARILQSEWEGHMPLSRRLYWYRGGTFSELPYVGRIETGGPAIEFAPPPALREALAQLEGA